MVQQSSRLPRRTSRPVVRRGSSLEVVEVQDRARSPIRVSGERGGERAEIGAIGDCFVRPELGSGGLASRAGRYISGVTSWRLGVQ